MDRMLKYKTEVACGANAMRKVFKDVLKPRAEPINKDLVITRPSFPKQGRTSNPHLQTRSSLKVTIPKSARKVKTRT